jgi:hypothetical protein
MTKRKKELQAVVDALDEVPIDPADARATVKRLGIDVKSLAKDLRARVASADSADARRRIDEARVAYAEEIERLERRKHEPARSRDEQLVVFRALLAKAPPESVAVHFLKYASASDEELAELIRSLRHLLGEDEQD